jgi:hypothetical protein
MNDSILGQKVLDELWAARQKRKAAAREHVWKLRLREAEEQREREPSESAPSHSTCAEHATFGRGRGTDGPHHRNAEPAKEEKDYERLVA